MLIGHLGAEPRQINSAERIMAWADIRPPSPTLTNTHSHLTAHKARGVGEGGLDGESGAQYGIMPVCDMDPIRGGLR